MIPSRWSSSPLRQQYQDLRQDSATTVVRLSPCPHSSGGILEAISVATLTRPSLQHAPALRLSFPFLLTLRKSLPCLFRFLSQSPRCDCCLIGTGSGTIKVVFQLLSVSFDLPLLSLSVANPLLQRRYLLTQSGSLQ